MKHPAAPTQRGRDGATCFAGIALVTQVESLLASAEPLAKPGRNPTKSPDALRDRDEEGSMAHS